MNQRLHRSRCIIERATRFDRRQSQDEAQRRCVLHMHATSPIDKHYSSFNRHFQTGGQVWPRTSPLRSSSKHWLKQHSPGATPGSWALTERKCPNSHVGFSMLDRPLPNFGAILRLHHVSDDPQMMHTHHRTSKGKSVLGILPQP